MELSNVDAIRRGYRAVQEDARSSEKLAVLKQEVKEKSLQEAKLSAQLEERMMECEDLLHEFNYMESDVQEMELHVMVYFTSFWHSKRVLFRAFILAVWSFFPVKNPLFCGLQSNTSFTFKSQEEILDC